MKTLSKKKKIIILSAMVALLLVTGYVNVALNSSLSSGITQTSSTTTSANFYTNYRNERETTRTQEIQFYDSIIASATSSDEAKEEAEANKLAIITQMEKELVTEGIIRGKGFEDAIVTSSSSNVNSSAPKILYGPETRNSLFSLKENVIVLLESVQEP